MKETVPQILPTKILKKVAVKIPMRFSLPQLFLYSGSNHVCPIAVPMASPMRTSVSPSAKNRSGRITRSFSNRRIMVLPPYRNRPFSCPLQIFPTPWSFWIFPTRFLRKAISSTEGGFLPPAADLTEKSRLLTQSAFFL